MNKIRRKDEYINEKKIHETKLTNIIFLNELNV